ncbi:MAG TPA: DUF1614 domain-containing protein [Mariprofundaceae bacterium]|nr:DUF1614 domain-containing protein [Mariprofundaceae bacterium]
MRGPFNPLHLIVFVMLLVFLLLLIQLGLVAIAFDKLGLSTEQGMLLLFASLLGSGINMRIFSIKAERPEPVLQDPSPKSLLRMPVLPFTGHTLIAVNVGGCMVPLVFSASLLHRFPFSWPEVAIAICLVAAVCYFTSRPVPGIGIGMPPLIAPIAAAIVAISINIELAAPLAYICGTLGVLVGADLLRLRDVAKLGAPVASIGGAGTFDGIFLTGIVAVLLA